MKWLIMALFVTGLASSFLWYEGADRNLTRLQMSAFGWLAVTAWALVLVLGNTML
jgi:hypothetical protein